MNEFSVWISIAALAISALALLQSRARYNAQTRLSLEQQRYDLRLDFHLACGPGRKKPNQPVVQADRSDAAG